jgi:hypothetical protein
MNKKYFIIIIAVVLCAVTSIVFLNHLSKQQGLIFTLFTPLLQRASDDFYSEYLSDNPSVANYSGRIISLKRNEHGFYIKFGIEPYLGPHYPVGYDEAEYSINNIGSVTLLNFSHKKNYDFPPRLGVTIKKPIPIS